MMYSTFLYCWIQFATFLLRISAVCEGPWSADFRNVAFWFGSRLVLASVSEVKSAPARSLSGRVCVEVVLFIP